MHNWCAPVAPCGEEVEYHGLRVGVVSDPGLRPGHSDLHIDDEERWHGKRLVGMRPNVRAKLPAEAGFVSPD
jgi:hypothetical protein